MTVHFSLIIHVYLRVSTSCDRVTHRTPGNLFFLPSFPSLGNSFDCSRNCRLKEKLVGYWFSPSFFIFSLRCSSISLSRFLALVIKFSKSLWVSLQFLWMNFYKDIETCKGFLCMFKSAYNLSHSTFIFLTKSIDDWRPSIDCTLYLWLSLNVFSLC